MARTTVELHLFFKEDTLQEKLIEIRTELEKISPTDTYLSESTKTIYFTVHNISAEEMKSINLIRNKCIDNLSSYALNLTVILEE
jgi:hypothetical protein